jgi:hypothetical protein
MTQDLEPSLADVELAWPRWHTFTSISGLVYATRGQTSPPAVVRGEDAQELLDNINGWEGTH